MQQRKGPIGPGRTPKPPIDLNQQQESDFEEDPVYQQQYRQPPPPRYYYPPPTQGPIGYAGGGGSSKKDSSGGGAMQILMAVILSAIVAIGAGWQMFIPKSELDSMNSKVEAAKTAVTASITPIQTQVNNLVNSQAQYVKKEVLTSEVKTAVAAELSTQTLVTKKQMDGAIADALKNYKPATTTGGTTTTTPVTGVINYTVENPQTYWTFSSPALVIVKYFNNKSTSRYIRPQLNIGVWGGTNAGSVTSATCSVVANTSGQTAVVFPPGTAVPVGTVTSVYWQGASGGPMSSGEYVLDSGSTMTVTYQVQVVSSTPALWTVEPSGSDRTLVY